MKVIFFDIEANGYQDVTSRETVQIGAIKHDYDTGKSESFEALIKPSKYNGITKHCYELTGISNKMIAQSGRSFKDVIEEFKKFSMGCLLVSWDEFDYKQLTSDCKRLELGAFFSRENNISYINFQKVYQLKYGINKKPSLRRVIKELEINSDITDSHSALTDSLNLQLVFNTTNSLHTICEILKIQRVVRIKPLVDCDVAKDDCFELIESGYLEELYFSFDERESKFKKNSVVEIDLFVDFDVVNKRKKVQEEVASILKNAVIIVRNEKAAENTIRLLNKNNIWDGSYIINY